MNPFSSDFYRMTDELAREMMRVRLGWVTAIERQLITAPLRGFTPPAGMREITVTERMYGPTEYRIRFISGEWVDFDFLPFGAKRDDVMADAALYIAAYCGRGVEP